MRTQADALRSVRRYTTLTLDSMGGKPWEVRLSEEQGSFHRPFARVSAVPGAQFAAEASHRIRVIQSFVIVCFPVEAYSADESQMNALAVSEALYQGFAGPGIDRGATYRIPLYDYDGIALDEPAGEECRDPRDFMRVDDSPGVMPSIDPNDDLLWSVAATLRMSWLRSAAVRSASPTTRSVEVEKERMQ